MHYPSSLLILAIITTFCAATEYQSKDQTTFVTITRPCSISTETASGVAVQHTKVVWPLYKEEEPKHVVESARIYTPKVEEHVSTSSELVKGTTYTNPAVKHETTLTSTVIEGKSTAAYVPKYEEYTSTTAEKYEIPTSHPVVQENVKSAPVKYESTLTIPSYAPANTPATYEPPPVIQDTTTSSHIPPTITTTIGHQTTTTTTIPPNTNTAQGYATYTLIPTPLTAECTCPSSPTVTQPPLTTHLPSLPLKQPTLLAIDSLLSLLLSIPDSILASGDLAISTFYTNLSTCVSSKGNTLKQSFLELSTVFDTIGDEITKGAEEAGGFIESLIGGGVPAATSIIGDIIEDKLPAVTSAIGDIIEDKLPAATSIIGDVISDALPAATSVVGDIVAEITAVPKKIVDVIGDFFNRDFEENSISTVAKRQVKRQEADGNGNALESLGEIVNGIDALRACLTSAISTNPVFEVAKCAASIASVAFPVGRVLRVRGLVAGVGGRIRVVQELGRAKDVVGIGREVLDLLGELSGVAAVVKDCEFIVD